MNQAATESPIPNPDYEVLLAQVAREQKIQPLVDLQWQQFATFIHYLFTCAGFEVDDVGNRFFPNGVGVDLNLYSDPQKTQIAFRVEVRRYDPNGNPLGSDAVFKFAGKLNGLRGGGIPGFLVTSSVFTGPAYDAEREYPDTVTLIDGAHLLRYIAYIYGSRVPQPDGRLRTPTTLPPTWIRLADDVRRTDTHVTQVLTVGNNKGGVAKTVTAMELGIGLAKRGKRVLLVDLDGQGSLTLALPPPSTPVPKKTGKKTAAAAAVEPSEPPAAPLADDDVSRYFVTAEQSTEKRIPLRSLVRPTAFEGVSLIPAGQLIGTEGSSHIVVSTLHRLDTGGSAHPGDELAFVSAIADVATSYASEGLPFDWVIIDTPPAQSRYTRAALAAAHKVLICLGVEVFAAQGVNSLLDTADTMRALLGNGIDIEGAIFTRFPAAPKQALRDERLKLVNQLATQSVRVLGDVPPDDKVDLSTRTAAKGGVLGTIKGLFGFASSPAAVAYNKIIDQL